MLRTPWIALSFAGGLVLVTGCEEKKEAPPAAAPAAPAAPAAAPGAAPAAAPGAAPAAAAPAAGGGTGSVKGTVALTGKAPVMEELKRNSDPFCAKTKMKDEQVVENANHTLKNVIVHINGAPAADGPKEPAMIEQQQCMYRPRVQGIVAGQTLSIKNGDPTLHNVHTYKGTSTLFNQAQVPNTPNIDKKFTDNGALLKFKCDVHQWMTGYVWVQNNPYFAVTGEDGSFEIKGVPAGKYEIEAWHERFGSKKMEVTVAADKPAEAKFEYTGTETASK
jgi:plastocyanin